MIALETPANEVNACYGALALTMVDAEMLWSFEFAFNNRPGKSHFCGVTSVS
jgi:hypothetical protein